MSAARAPLSVARARARNAVLLAFAGDAVAMPVHWFYDPKAQLPAAGLSDPVTGFEAVPAKHPYTFMKAPEASAAAGGKKIIGDVIHKDTAKLWGPENQHPHVSLSKGDSTLNAEVALRTTLKLLAEGAYSPQAYIAAYVDFMTSAPQQAKDTYAEGFHRAFFEKYVAAGGDAGVAAAAGKCADETEGAESCGGWTSVTPLIVLELARDGDVSRVQKLAREHVALTHNRARLLEVTDSLVALVAALLFRVDDGAAVADAVNGAFAGSKSKFQGGEAAGLAELLSKADRDVVSVADSKIIGSFCDVSASFPAVLYLTLKYAGKPAEGILANANVGGENCHRGFVAATLLALTSDEGAAAAVATFEKELAVAADVKAAVDATVATMPKAE